MVRAKNTKTKQRNDSKKSPRKASLAKARASKTSQDQIYDDSPEARAKKHSRAGRSGEDAESMAKRQREISVSEFFAKNRHLLGFDNPRKALLTAVKEAVDNSLDACEEAEILPVVRVELKRLSAKLEESTEEEEAAALTKRTKRRAPTPTERFLLRIIDNGPGIVPAQIPKIFAKLLYGSKFHRLKMSRGQQGIGISAAGMYGQMTTGIPVRIYSKLPRKNLAHYIELQIDTKANKPVVLAEKEVKWPETFKSGTIVEITLEGRYQRGKSSVDEFILQNTLSNPHAHLCYIDPDGQKFDFPAKTKELPEIPKEIKPHPYGVELGQFHRLASEASAKTIKKFLCADFSRVSDKVADAILKEAGIKDQAIAKLAPESLNKIHESIPKVEIMNPPTDCVVPIGENLIMETLRQKTGAEFFTATTRSPSVYRGNPFIVECALAFGGELGADEPMQVFRFANRVPLLFQPAACATTRVLGRIDWKKYGLNQSKNSLPVGPVAVLVHVASVWVPFTSESKEAIADYPEIKQEIRLAIQDCARKLSIHLSKRYRAAEAARKANYIDTYIPFIGEALQDMLKLSEKQKGTLIETLRDTLEKSKIEA